MAQVVGIVDAHGYRPFVRQVYAHRVFRPSVGEPAEEAEVARGLAAAGPVLTALEAIAAEGLALDGGARTLADCHLAPMLAAFVQTPEGSAALTAYPALAAWWEGLAGWDALAATDPSPPS